MDAGSQKIEVNKINGVFPPLFLHLNVFDTVIYQWPQVSNPDGDLRRTLVNSSVLEHPRALALLSGERYGDLCTYFGISFASP